MQPGMSLGETNARLGADGGSESDLIQRAPLLGPLQGGIKRADDDTLPDHRSDQSHGAECEADPCNQILHHPRARVARINPAPFMLSRSSRPQAHARFGSRLRHDPPASPSGSPNAGGALCG